MEVHHHPDVEHKRKKFKEYFFEFLMIFLAVTLGFFAEGLREHIGDKDKEGKYIESLEEDLKEDTVAITRQMAVNADNLTHIDSIEATLLAGNLDQQSIIKVYRLYPYTLDDEDVTFNDKTYLQLQSTGSLRLINHPDIVNEIINYQRGIKDCRDQASYYTKFLYDVSAESKNIFNAKYTFDLRKAAITYSDTGVVFRSSYFAAFDSLAATTKFDFISTDKKVFSSYCYTLDTYARIIISYLGMIKRQKKMAIKLMAHLHEKYD
jgi:hypothetical protein